MGYLSSKIESYSSQLSTPSSSKSSGYDSSKVLSPEKKVKENYSSKKLDKDNSNKSSIAKSREILGNYMDILIKIEQAELSLDNLYLQKEALENEIKNNPECSKLMSVLGQLSSDEKNKGKGL